MKKNHFKLLPIYTYHNFTHECFLAKYRDFYCYNIRLDHHRFASKHQSIYI